MGGGWGQRKEIEFYIAMEISYDENSLRIFLDSDRLRRRKRRKNLV